MRNILSALAYWVAASMLGWSLVAGSWGSGPGWPFVAGMLMLVIGLMLESRERCRE